MTTNADATDADAIGFTAALAVIDETVLVRLPDEASRRLPSRGQVAAHATLDGHPFETVVEPDGRRGHWIRVDGALLRRAELKPGDSAGITLTVMADWPEPDVPVDLRTALADAPGPIREVWDDITPMARWEWVRWVQATANPQTRQRRVEVSLSKMESGKRRPCCFDLSSCTDPTVSRSGKLRETP